MKAKFALVLSLLLSFYLFADGIELDTDLDDVAEQEVSSVEAVVTTYRFKDSWRSRSRRRTTALMPLSGGFGDRADNLLASARIKKLPIFSHQELYSFQQVFRL